MNKCGNCHWLVTEEGKPYYCALRDLYTIRDVQDSACEEYIGGAENETIAIERWNRRVDDGTKKTM